MARIGLIGVGNVGSGFARVLLERGFPLVVHDQEPTHAQRAGDLGAQVVDSPAAVAAAAEVILLSLPGSHAVTEVMEGPAGLLAHLQPGHLVVDTGTTHPDTDIHYQRLCQERGAALVDAPITGRRQGWIFMLGGRDEDVARAAELISVLAYQHRHVGPLGSGQVLKLANQMVLAGQWAVWAEAIEFTRQAGMEPRLLSDYLEFPIADGLYGDDFAAGGQLALHYKDLGYALDLAHHRGAQVPLTGLVHEVFKAVKASGQPDWNQMGIVTYWRRLHRPPG